MKATSVVIEVLFVLLLAACSRHNAELSRAEEVVESSPDSAYVELSKVGEEKLLSSEDRAKYALLRTQVNDKLDIPQVSDTLIMTAVNFYERTEEEELLMKSLLYLGKIRYSNKDTYGAMSVVARAYDIAVNLKDTYWEAKCAELMMFMFFDNYNFDEAKKYAQIAAEKYREDNRELSYYYNRVDYANAVAADKEYDKALEILSEIPTQIETEADSALLAYSDRIKFYSYFESGRYSKADSVFNEMNILARFQCLSPIEYARKMAMLAYQGKNDSIPFYEQLTQAGVTSEDHVRVLTWARIEVAESQGRYQDALKLAKTRLEQTDVERRRVFKNLATKGQRDFLSGKIQEEHIVSEHRRTALILLSVISILVISGLLWFIRLKIRIKNLQIDSYVNRLLAATEVITRQHEDNLRLETRVDEINAERKLRESAMNDYAESIDEMDRQNRELRKTVESLFLEGWKTENMLCREFWNHDIKDGRGRETCLMNIKRQHDKMLSAHNIKRLEADVNRYRENLMKKARESLTFLQEKDFQLLCMIYSGMSNQMIDALIFDYKGKTAVYKQRLKRKILDSSAPDREYFTARMESL